MEGQEGGHIFIKENLTRKRKKIFKVCLDLRRNKKIFSSWTSDGKIFVKKYQDSKAIKVVYH